MTPPERPSPGGVLVVDKPGGPTSHDVVDRVRSSLGERRVGHTGTLDPFATGVLVVCVGKATRLVRFLAEGDKVYRARIRLGFATTTDDLTGEPLGEPRPVAIGAGVVAVAAASLVGVLQQVPPRYSAKRVGGRRLYELARAGRDEPREPVAVHVHEFRVLEVAGDVVDAEVRCSPGTYVRALARDLGERLGVGGHLSALRRTASGAFTLDDAVAADDLSPSSWQRVRPLCDLLPEMPAVRLSEAGVEAVQHGRALRASEATAGFPGDDGTPWLRLLDAGGALLGLAVPRVIEAPGRETLALQPSIVLV